MRRLLAFVALFLTAFLPSATGQGVRIDITGPIDTIDLMTSKVRVVVKTQADSPYTVAAQDVRRSIITNTGASGSLTANLPAAVQGMAITAVINATQTIVLVRSGAEVIVDTTGAAYTQITLAATVGTSATLVCVVTGKWMVVGSVGTYTPA